VRRLSVLAAVAVLAGCGGGSGSKQNVPKSPPPDLASRCGDDAQGVDAKLVWFRASDGALLDGAALGDGDTAVVLAHGNPADLCAWLPYAKTLASRGYLALTFDLRGFGASPPQYAAKAVRVDRDVVAAYDEARRLGAERVFLVGGSYGGSAVVWAGSEMGSKPAGIIDFSGPTWLFDIDDRARKVEAPLLVVSAREDGVVSPRDARQLVTRARSQDKQVAIYPGEWHAWDLVYAAPYKARVNALVFAFLRKHSE
jgi:alpha-beta hydrolase superfamily lysophospholipase